MNEFLLSASARLPGWLDTWVAMNLQIAAFGLLVLLADTLLRDAPTRFRHGLWLLVLVKAFVPPVLSLPAGASSASLTELSLPPITVPLFGSPQPVFGLLLAVIVVIVLASLGVGSLAVARTLRVRAKLRGAEAVSLAFDLPGSWPEVRVSGRIASPLAAGLLRPIIYVTPELLRGPEQALRAVLFHELAHVRRRDRYVVLLQTVSQIVFALNPMVWIMNMRLHRYREQLCDAWALERSGGRPQEYGRLLLGYAARNREPRLELQGGTCFFETRRGFVQRITMLFNPAPRMRARVLHYAVGVSILLAIVPLSWRCGDGVNPGDGAVDSQHSADWGSLNSFDVKHPTSSAKVRGGMEALRRRLVYPDEARKRNLQGMVVVQVEVRRDGTVGALEVLKRAHPLLDAAALDAVGGLAFQPAVADGRAVDSRLAIPIRFALH